MAVKYKCVKYGILGLHERVMWYSGSIAGRWCVYCINNIMDQFCGKLIEIEEETKEFV
jgi:hypothetical protein